MKFACYTLGCKVNQYETQAMEQLLMQSGHTLGSFDEICDGYIINTCTVTAVSDKKSRNAIRRVRKLNPNAVVGVCGCYAQSSPDEIRKLDVDVLIGTDGREAFVRHMIGAAQTRQKWDCVDDAGGPRTFEILPAGGLAARTRALLKVEDGCNNFCTYCIIPYARGRVRSMPLNAAVEQAKALAAEGYREVVLTGIHLASWGLDSGEGDLNDVLRMAAGIDGLPRIRLGSLEPKFCDERFAETVAALPAVCPQFHLSLQSGSDAVLKRMNRRYTTEEYLRSVALLRQASPSCAVTTDVIAGFVGETQQEHEETLAFVERAAFARIHVFPYSRRRGTKADAMPGHLPKRVREARAAELIRLGDRLETAFVAGMAGKRANVLIESGGEGYTENYVRVRIVSGGGLLPVDPCREGDLVRVLITGADGKTALGEPV